MEKRQNLNLGKHTAGADRVFNYLNAFYLFCFFLLVLYPVVYVVSASISSPSALVRGKVTLFPVDISFEGYKKCFTNREMWNGFGNSLFYTFFGTLLSISLTIGAAYPLSRKDFAPRNVLMLVFSFTMWFSGGLIPSYILVKGLGMINSRLAIILPSAISVYNVIITRTFFQSQIPNDLLESAKLDGCDDFTFLIQIVLPLSKAILAVNALFYGVSIWNSYFSSFIYLTDRSKFPLQIFLREILIMSKQISEDIGRGVIDFSSMSIDEINNQQFMSEQLKYTLIIVSSLPLICAYPFVQKSFVKGVMIGAIKG